MLTPAIGASVAAPADGWEVSASYLADIVSAASVDVVSTASPRWEETRHAGTLAATYKPGNVGGTLMGALSREPDYLALSAGAALDSELADKTVNPRISYSYAHDTAGRSGTPFSVFSLELVRHTAGAGIELVAGPSTVVAIGVEAAFEKGNSEKPYRFLPLFAPELAPVVPAGASAELVNQLRLPGRVAEQLPETRRRLALSARLAHRFSGSTLVASERLYADDWGLEATTTEAQFIVDAGQRLFLWATLRGHFQSGVGFWRRAYVATASATGTLSVPRFRTGDSELSPLESVTLGPGVRWHVGSSMRPSAWSLVAQADFMATRFSDALFIRLREAYLGILQLEGEL